MRGRMDKSLDGAMPTSWSWGVVLQTYGLQVLVALSLCAITVFRRELSCNKGYHDQVGGAPNRTVEEDEKGNEENKLCNAIAGRGLSSTGSFSERNDSHVALLERDSFGLSFAPTISFITFLCRVVYIIGTYPFRCLWSRIVNMKNIKVEQRNNYESSSSDLRTCENSSEIEKMTPSERCTVSGDSLGKALTDKWEECRLHGFHVDSYSNLLTLAVGSDNYQNESRTCEKSGSHVKYQVHSLPTELAFSVLSFVPVSDVLQFGMVNKAAYHLVRSPRIANEFWSGLCRRDFDGLLRWPVAQLRFKESQQRSTHSLRKEQGGVLSETYATREDEAEEPNNPKIERSAANSDMIALIDKWHRCFGRSINQAQRRAIYEFYFLLLECWLPWSVALRNTTQDCLVGLHGAVYDITAFLPHHPGSVETLLVHAGSDATEMFETVRHSRRARTLGNGYCVMVPLPDPPRTNGAREHSLPARGRHEYLKDISNEDSPFNMIRKSLQNFLTSKRRTLEVKTRDKLNQQSEVIVGDTVHTFYDPFIESWCSWYTSLTLQGDLEPVMIYCDG